MTFAPAMGIACLQVLGGLCFVVAALTGIMVVKHLVAPLGDVSVPSLLTISGLFVLGGLACLWAAKRLLRLVRGE